LSEFLPALILLARLLFGWRQKKDTPFYAVDVVRQIYAQLWKGLDLLMKYVCCASPVPDIYLPAFRRDAG
jgi:hypothetical protein